MTGYIYLICSEHQDAGKIGWATDPKSRVVKAQTNNPAKLNLFAQVEASRAVEGELHAALSGTHIRGEWFSGVDRLEAIFRELEDLSGARDFDGESSETAPPGRWLRVSVRDVDREPPEYEARLTTFATTVAVRGRRPRAGRSVYWIARDGLVCAPTHWAPPA